ncbi:MAG: biotin/lipoate A/B protein ligase family protein [Candidatus Nanohaloarchaea archaeon]
MSWRVIPFRKYDPYFKTGLNRALMESLRENPRPVVFLAGWDQDTVNVGYSQQVEEQVDTEEVEERDIAVVRRQGGGGTTYLRSDGEITWGIVAPESFYPDDLDEVYRRVCGRIASGLEEIGIGAEHEPVNDVVTGNGKISGATAKKERGVIYIGGTLLYDVDPEEMFQVLTPGEEKIEDKEIRDFRERVTSVRKESDASFEEAVEAVRKGLLDGREYEEDRLTDQERSRAEELAEKYRTDEWIYQE